MYKGQRVETYIQLCFLVQTKANDFRACGRSDGEVHRRSGVALPGFISSGVQGTANYEHTRLHFVVRCLTISLRNRVIAGRTPVNLGIKI